MGFAYELMADAATGDAAKPLLEKAGQEYRALENTDIEGFKELGMYHQARVLSKQGTPEPAIELLKKLHERLHKGAEGHEFVYLEQVADDALRSLAPEALPPRPSMASMGGMGGLQGLGGRGRGAGKNRDRPGAAAEDDRAAPEVGEGSSAARSAEVRLLGRCEGASAALRLALLGVAAASVAGVAACSFAERVNAEGPLWLHHRSGAIEVFSRGR